MPKKSKVAKKKTVKAKIAKKKTVKKLAKKSVAKPTTIAMAKKPARAALEASGEIRSLIGHNVPTFKVASTGRGDTALSDFSGRRIVLYFYPKDNTPGCTLEGYDFKRLKQEFDLEKTVILGVSKDSLKSHENFKNKCGFPFELLSDQEEKLCRAFDVIQMKSLYGRKFLGIERSTFVINESGKIVGEWRKVKVNGHAEEVLDFLRKL